MLKYKKYKNLKFQNKKNKNKIILANLHIKCSLKNTLISLTQNTGQVLKQWSTKSLKKTKFKKNTPYNIQLIIYKINKYIQFKKINKLNLHFNGSGLGRYNVLKNLKKNYIKIRYIFDKTPRPFNGCRKKKMKRR